MPELLSRLPDPKWDPKYGEQSLSQYLHTRDPRTDTLQHISLQLLAEHELAR